MTHSLHTITEPTEESPSGIPINHAPPEQLAELPRIGIERALEILRHRPFKTVKGVTRVKGIGPKTRPKSMSEYLKEKTASLATITRASTRVPKSVTETITRSGLNAPTTKSYFSNLPTDTAPAVRPITTRGPGTRVSTIDGDRRPTRAEALRLQKLTPQQLQQFHRSDVNLDSARLMPEEEALRRFVLFGHRPGGDPSSVRLNRQSQQQVPEGAYGYRPIGNFENPLSDMLHKFRRYMGWDKRASEKTASSRINLLRALLRSLSEGADTAKQEVPSIAGNASDFVPSNDSHLLSIIEKELQRAPQVDLTPNFSNAIDPHKIIENIWNSGVKTSSLVDLAPKWSDKSHIVAALKQHLGDTQASIGTDKENKELVDLGLILDAYRQTQMPTYSELLKDRLDKFREYADAPSLGKTASLRELLRNLDSGSSRFVRHVFRAGDSGKLSGNCLTLACNLRHALERRGASVDLVRTQLDKGVAFGVRSPKGDVYHGKLKNPDGTMLRDLLDKERVVKMPEWLAKYTFKKAEEFNRDRSPEGLPYRDRVEAYAFDDDGKLYGGKYPDGAFGTFGGGIDEGEDAISAAVKEYAEEAGRELLDPQLIDVEDYIHDWKPPYATEKQRERAKQYKGSRLKFVLGRLGNQIHNDLDISNLTDIGHYDPEEALSLLTSDDPLKSKRKEVLKQILRSKTASISKDLYLEHIAPAGAIDGIRQHGILSSLALASNEDALALARPDEKEKEKWLTRLQDEKDLPHRAGPNMFLGMPPESTKLPEGHALLQPNVKLRVQLKKLLDRYPDTKFHGLELEPIELLDVALKRDGVNWEDLTLKQKLEYKKNRYRELNVDELGELIRRSPKDLWKHYSGEAGMYAPNVPHVSVITPSGKIDPDLLEESTIKTASEFNRDRDPEGLPYRAVAEALLFNRDGKILSDIKGPPENRYYKFPGGGIDDGEDPETGLRRELIEEVGANPKKLELLEKLDWDWWPEWASSEKQKKRYMDYRGEGSHQFGGLVDELVEPTSEEGDAWEDRPFQDPNKILRHLKKELPALPKEQAPYRELQIRALKEAIKRFSNVKPNR